MCCCLKITACHEYIAWDLNLLGVNGPLECDLKSLNAIACKSNYVTRSLQPITCLNWFSFMVIDLIVTDNY